MLISREVALNEVRLDHEASLNGPTLFREPRRMPIARILAAVGALLLSAWVARADSIVTGSLSGTCDSGCFSTSSFGITFAASPASGTFSYDRTTQVLSLSILWDGFTYVDTLNQTAYLALLGHGPYILRYDAFCDASGEFPWPQTSCDNGHGFALWAADKSGDPANVFLGTQGPMQVSFAGTSTFAYDNVTGTLMDPPTRTPEPSAWFLLACALLAAWLIGRCFGSMLDRR